MNPAWWAAALAVGLFAALLVCLDVGFRLGMRAVRKDPENWHQGIGPIEAAVFALLGLLLGFSFAGATSRLDQQREMVVREANSIGTAYLRLDLLPPPDQPPMRDLFREYLDVRLRMSQGNNSPYAYADADAKVSDLQHEIWSRAIEASRTDSTQNTARLLLPALNEMIDITTARSIAARTHLPLLIFSLLAMVALLSGLLAGYAMAKRKTRSWLHAALYAAAIAMTVYTVVDLDNPRSGFIHLAAADEALKGLRSTMR